ncbi:MAG: hypothetical protein ACRYG4_22500 [Janthinobacterium lividum]
MSLWTNPFMGATCLILGVILKDWFEVPAWLPWIAFGAAALSFCGLLAELVLLFVKPDHHDRVFRIETEASTKDGPRASR